MAALGRLTVVDNGSRVFAVCVFSTNSQFMPLVNVAVLNVGELRHPLFDVLAVRVEFLTLHERVEWINVGWIIRPRTALP